MENALSPTLYFIDIGNPELLAAAVMARQLGFLVTGSISGPLPKPAAEILKKWEVSVVAGYFGKNITESHADIFIAPSNLPLHNIERRAVVSGRQVLNTVTQLLAQLFRSAIRVVVTGNTQASIASGMLAFMMQNIDESSSIVQAKLQGSQDNYFFGPGNYFLYEGTVRPASVVDPVPLFHYLNPDILVITNTTNAPEQSYLVTEYEQLASVMPGDGLFIYNADDVELEAIAYGLPLHTYSFGIQNDAHFFLEQVEYQPSLAIVRIRKQTVEPTTVEEYILPHISELNIYGALASITLLRVLGFSPEFLNALFRAYPGISAAGVS